MSNRQLKTGEGQGEREDESCQACLFGRELGNYGDSRMMFYPKPAYYGVRNAITNYFGAAFSVKDSSGEELVRFVENGNVLLMKEGATVYEQVGPGQNWPILADTCFAVLNGDCDQVAAVDQDGNVYLAGQVLQSQPPEDMQAAEFEIRRQSDNVLVSLIDSDGNLKLLGASETSTGGESNPDTGYLLLHGIPYDLDLSRCTACQGDAYSPW